MGLKKELSNFGIKIINDHDDSQEEIGMTDKEISEFKPDPSVIAVVVGYNTSFSYRKLTTASLYI